MQDDVDREPGLGKDVVECEGGAGTEVGGDREEEWSAAQGGGKG